MANPFTAERKQQLQDDAQEFLTSFGLEYTKTFTVCVLEKIQKELEVKDKVVKKKLKYRPDTQKVERSELFKGTAFMKVGGGPGGFSKFRPVYIVETKDYNIDVYATQKDYDAKKKPKHTILVAGYKLQRDPSDHYYKVLHALASGLGISEEDLRAKTTFSQYAWALSHDWRTNYVFQLHMSKEPSCGCMGGKGAVEPAGKGSEEAKNRDSYIKMFDRCTKKACPRNKKVVKGKAFQGTAAKMTVQHPRLYDFVDDGTESQILTDMLMQQCFSPMRDDMINDMKGPVGMRLTIWFKMRVAILDVMQKMVDPAWDKMQSAAGTLQEKIEPKIKEGAEPIFELKAKTKQKIRDTIVDHTSKLLSSHVTPHLKPIMQALEEPLKKAFEQQRLVYEKQVPEIEKLPDDEKQRNSQLDKIPRQSSVTKEMTEVTYELVEPLKKLVKISDTIFGTLDPYKYRQECEDALIDSLDAAIYTLQQNIKEYGKKNELKDQVLESFDHDAILVRRDFTKDVLCDLLVNGFKKALNPVVEPVISTLDDLIPEAMQDFLSISELYNELVSIIIGEPIEKMIDAAYPPP